MQRMVSSVGRAPPLQGGGHWFEPSTIHHHQYISQWMVSSAGRAPPLQGGGHWFEPSTIHHNFRISTPGAQSTARSSLQHGCHRFEPSTIHHNFRMYILVLKAPPAPCYDTVVTGSSPVPSTIISEYIPLELKAVQEIFREFSFIPVIKSCYSWFNY